MTDSDIDDISTAIQDRDIDVACALIERFGSELDLADAVVFMANAREIDPTFSGPGATVRDALKKHTRFNLS